MRNRQILVFKDGEDKPMTIKDLAIKTGLKEYLIRSRQYVCKKRKDHGGKSCAIFTEYDLQETIRSPYTILAFVDGEDEPLTIPELSERTGIDKDILRSRSHLCKKRKILNGKDCAVFTEYDLQKPRRRNCATFVFVDGELTTIPAISGEKGISGSVLRKRSYACETRRMHNGKSCAVFSEQDLQVPMPVRQFEKVIPTVAKKAMSGIASSSIAAWDRRVIEQRV